MGRLPSRGIPSAYRCVTEFALSRSVRLDCAPELSARLGQGVPCIEAGGLLFSFWSQRSAARLFRSVDFFVVHRGSCGAHSLRESCQSAAGARRNQRAGILDPSRVGSHRSRLVRQQMAESASIVCGRVFAGNVYLDLRPDYRMFLFALDFAGVTCLLLDWCQRFAPRRLHWKGVLILIFKESATLIAFGLVAGVFLAVALGRSIAALLFGTTPYDPSFIALACAVLTAVGMTAAAIPALRAVRLDPVSARGKSRKTHLTTVGAAGRR
jgi:hypothetical protein